MTTRRFYALLFLITFTVTGILDTLARILFPEVWP